MDPEHDQGHLPRGGEEQDLAVGDAGGHQRLVGRAGGAELGEDSPQPQ